MSKSHNLTAREILRHPWSLYVRRHFNWMVQATQIEANSSKALKKYLGFDPRQKSYLILNGDEYGSEIDVNRVNTVFEKHFHRDTGFFNRFSKKIFTLVRQVKNQDTRLRQTNFRKLSLVQLAKAVEQFQEYYLRSFIPAWSRPDSFLEQKTKALLQEIYHFTSARTEAQFKKLATYPALGPLAYSNEPLDLLRLARQIKRRKASLKKLPSDLQRRLMAHVRKYGWMKGPILVEEIAFAEKDYRSRLRTLLKKNISAEITKIHTARAANETDFRRTTKELNPPRPLRKLIDASRLFIFLRTHTTEISDHFFFTARQTVLRECARRLKLSPRQIVTLTAPEIAQLLRGQRLPARKIITERHAGFAIVWVTGKLQLLFGPAAAKLQHAVYEKSAERIAVSTGLAIKGLPGAPGKARGRAKVLRSYCDAGKLRKGDILVASMTTPDYIAAMEKAAAFVTDEGGITCHAAIVAREFGVPCVIGTQNATKVLKDNDWIEVDADRGLVKKTNRHTTKNGAITTPRENKVSEKMKSLLQPSHL